MMEEAIPPHLGVILATTRPDHNWSFPPFSQSKDIRVHSPFLSTSPVGVRTILLGKLCDKGVIDVNVKRIHWCLLKEKGGQCA